MNFRFTKQEKLKSKTSIDKLFQEGKGIVKFPIKMQYMPHSKPTHQIAFSVPKRNFKRAVDRNRIKRQLREAYRLNKHIIFDKNLPPQAIFFIYIGKKLPEYDLLEKRMKICLKELSRKAIKIQEE